MGFNAPKFNTFVIVVTVLGYIDRCLETLYKYTEPGSFYVFVIDQTIEGMEATMLRNKYRNLMVIRSPKSDLHETGNLGHSQATNIGIRLAETPYVTLLNDDVEFISPRWWTGVLETFEKVKDSGDHREAIMVNPASIKLPDWSLGRPKGDDHYILPYKEQYTNDDYDFLVGQEHYCNEHLTLVPGSVIDGVNLYCSVCDTRKLKQIGMIDEYWYPGTANDYDLSCRAGMYGYRTVGTTLSWVFHHWSVTFNSEEQKQKLLQPELVHGDLRDKWDDRLDVWGVRCAQKAGETRLRTVDGRTAWCPEHPHETYQIPPITIEAL